MQTRSLFKEITFNPMLTSALIDYFTKDGSHEQQAEYNMVKEQIVRMQDSGTNSHIIFSYLLSVFQVLRMKGHFNLAININKMQNILHIIFPDEQEYVKRLSMQLIGYYIQTDETIRNNPQISDALKRILN